MAETVNTLRYSSSRCINCGMCYTVCPHGVFAAPMVPTTLSKRTPGGAGALLRRPTARLIASDKCMECGACQRNCPVQAIQVDSGVGCATGIINGMLLRWGLLKQGAACCETSGGNGNEC